MLTLIAPKTTPFFPALLALIIGIGLQPYLNIPMLMLAILACAMLAATIIASIRLSIPPLRHAITLTCIAFLGSLLIQAHIHYQAACYQALTAKKLTTYGTVSEICKRVGSSRARYELTLDVTHIQEQGSQEQKQHTCSLMLFSPIKPTVEVDDTISVSNLTFPQRNVSNDLARNTYQRYLIKQGALASIFLTRQHELTLLQRPTTSLRRWVWQTRQTIWQRITSKLSSKAGSYFSLIFLGNKHVAHIDQLRHEFCYWGLSHYLARSGLHIVFFILGWTYVLRCLPVHIHFKRLFLLLLCFLYHLFSWASISFLRTVYVLFLMQTGALLGQHTLFAHLLTVVCMLVLLCNPFQLFFLDFQLTFALTFTLVLLANEKKHNA